MKRKLAALILLPLMLLSACTGYKSQYVSFKPPEAYANRQLVDGIAIGGEAYADKSAADDAFGFDIRGAGLLPVQLVLNNQSGRSQSIVTNQTFLVDNAGRYWQVVPNSVAVDRLESSTQLAAFFGKGAGQGAVLGAAGGAILGAALGIVAGKSVGEAAGKGAALGAAGGAVIGGAKQGTSPERERRIIDDIRDKGLEGKEIPAEYLANGFLFFPGEANSAKEIRLQLLERDNGIVRSFILPLK
ncbi:MAG TPA: glycine zipper family protein [Geobacteraceae bacterium]